MRETLSIPSFFCLITSGDKRGEDERRRRRRRRRAHTHPKKRVFDFQGLPIRHALHTGNQVKLFFCFPNSFHGIMNIICPEETPSEIDAALQEMLENIIFFFGPPSYSSHESFRMSRCVPLIPDAAMIRERLRLKATKETYVQCGQMTVMQSSPSAGEEGALCRVQHVPCKVVRLAPVTLRCVLVILIGQEVSGVSGESKTLEPPRDLETPLLLCRW